MSCSHTKALQTVRVLTPNKTLVRIHESNSCQQDRSKTSILWGVDMVLPCSGHANSLVVCPILDLVVLTAVQHLSRLAVTLSKM